MAKRGLENFLLGTIRLSSYLILFTPLILNGSFFFPFVAPKSLYFFAFSEIIFFSWLALIFINPKYKPKYNLVLLGLIIYLSIFILASIFGVNPSFSFWSKYERMTGVLMHLHLFGFFLALSSVFEIEDFHKIFAFSIFIAFFIGLHAVFNVENQAMRGGGWLGNESFLGTYLLFNCFFALYLIFEAKNFPRTFSIISFLILTIILLFVGVSLKGLSFREAILALLLKVGARAAKISLYGGIFLVFLLWLTFSKKRIFRIVGIFVLVPSLILVSFALYSIMFFPQSYFRQLLEKEVGAFSGRFYVWEIAGKAFLERPFLGWGPENFEYPFFKYYNPCFGTEPCGYETWYDRAHNIVFDTLSTTGILGLISYFSLFFCNFFVLWKNFLKQKISFWPLGIFVSLFVAYFVQNLTVFDMVSSYLMLFLSFAFIASLEKEILIKKPERKSVNPIILFSTFLLFLASFFYFVLQPILANTTFIEAIKKPFFSEERVSLSKKALSLSPLGKFQLRQHLAQLASLKILQELLKISNSQSSTAFFDLNLKAELQFLEEELKKSIKECPLEYRSYLLLAEILTYASIFDKPKISEAEKIAQTALQLSPKNQKSYWVLAQNMLFQQKPEEAIALAQKALDLEPNFPVAYLDYIKIAILAKREDLAKKKLEEFQKSPEYEKYLQRVKTLDTLP